MNFNNTIELVEIQVFLLPKKERLGIVNNTLKEGINLNSKGEK